MVNILSAKLKLTIVHHIAYQSLLITIKICNFLLYFKMTNKYQFNLVFPIIFSMQTVNQITVFKKKNHVFYFSEYKY